MKLHLARQKSDRKLLAGMFASTSLGFCALALGLIVDAKGMVILDDVAVNEPSIEAMIADEDLDTDGAAMLAMSRLGYVPEGMNIDAVAAEAKKSEFIVASLDGLSFLSAAVFEKDDALFEIDGIHALPREALCQGEGGVIFPCAEWIAEGVDSVLMASRSFRCSPSDGSDKLERAATLMSCEMNIGGDWFDYAEWGVENGYAIARENFAGSDLAADAQSAPYGVWKAGWNAPGIDIAPVRNEFSPEEVDQVWQHMQPR